MSTQAEFRLYVDESGDRVRRHLDDPSKRFLCLLGCLFRREHHEEFKMALEGFKTKHFPEQHDPDAPVILHLLDIMHRRNVFHRLRDEEMWRLFWKDLLAVLKAAKFQIMCVFVDKRGFLHSEDDPYVTAFEVLVNNYADFLRRSSATGQAFIEQRGRIEDHQLRQKLIAMKSHDSSLQAVLPNILKAAPKGANTAGLQLADLLVTPVKDEIRLQQGLYENRVIIGTQEWGLLAAVAGSRYCCLPGQTSSWGYGRTVLLTPDQRKGPHWGPLRSPTNKQH